MISPQIIGPYLILQDMRHYQLILLLERLQLPGVDIENHHLDLAGVLAQLLGLPRAQVPDAWMDVYLQYLSRAAGFPITGNGAPLRSLAQECFAEMQRMSSRCLAEATVTSGMNHSDEADAFS